MILPLGIALPLVIWATIKINAQVRTNNLIHNKYLVTFELSWAVVAVAVCFYFLLEAAMSHGAVPAELFRENCLFAINMLVIYPLIDIVFLRYRLKSGAKYSPKIRYSQSIVKGIVLVSAVSILADIVSPPLNAALRRNYSTSARALVYLRSDLNKSDRYKCTPLWYALHKADLNMTAFLLDNGAHLEKRFEGMALTRAVESNNIDLLRLLLSKGIDPDSTYMGATPLVYACLKKDVEAVKTLLENGADINIRSKFPNMPYDGKSAVDIASENGAPQLIKLIIGNSVK